MVLTIRSSTLNAETPRSVNFRQSFPWRIYQDTQQIDCVLVPHLVMVPIVDGMMSYQSYITPRALVSCRTFH